MTRHGGAIMSCRRCAWRVAPLLTAPPGYRGGTIESKTTSSQRRTGRAQAVQYSTAHRAHHLGLADDYSNVDAQVAMVTQTQVSLPPRGAGEEG